MRRLFLFCGGVLATLFACGDDGDAATGGATSGVPDADGGSGTDGGAFAPDGAPLDPVVPPRYGRFGVPEKTFTLPAPKGTAIDEPNLSTKYGDVDWTTLDRLYIPAGTYDTMILGGLPERTAERPLVITNAGGQVRIGGKGKSFVVSIRGGKNWILTGRYDPESRTGDAGFRGHAEGAFAHSQGTYGIFVDDAFSTSGNSGIAVGSKATDYELEMIEVARAEFAGIIAKTDNDGTATMRNVKLHDTYIHDTGSEGIYFGSTQAQPQHAFENLHVHDNRILRTGTEALQVGQLGSGCEVDHNVLGPGAVRWRSAFALYQDGNVQYGQRYGSSSFHHNVVVGTGDLFVEFFPTVAPGDTHAPGDTVTFADNYFADSSSAAVFTQLANETGVTVRFERNVFRGFTFDYDEVYPAAEPPVGLVKAGAGTTNPHFFTDNVADSPYPFYAYAPASNVTLTNNELAAVPRIAFRDFMNAAIDESYRRLEWWTPTATLAAGAPPMTYPVGRFVVDEGILYEAIAESTGKKPKDHPEAWKVLPAPADDVRLAPGSPHAGLGLRWPPP